MVAPMYVRMYVCMYAWVYDGRYYDIVIGIYAIAVTLIV